MNFGVRDRWEVDDYRLVVGCLLTGRGPVVILFLCRYAGQVSGRRSFTRAISSVG